MEKKEIEDGPANQEVIMEIPIKEGIKPNQNGSKVGKEDEVLVLDFPTCQVTKVAILTKISGSLIEAIEVDILVKLPSPQVIEVDIPANLERIRP